MIKILGIDASAETCSVALQHDRGMNYLESDRPRAHAELLLPMADQLLQDAGLTLNALDAIACSAGPGSFTGLRIAFGIAQGLAYGASLPLFMVSSLSVLAESAQAQLNLAPKTALISVLDARMGELYWSSHTVEGQSEFCCEVDTPQLSSPEMLQARIGELVENQNVCVVGSDVGNTIHGDFFPCFPRADALIKLAERHHKTGIKPSAAQAELLYLRNSVSWNKRNRIRHPNS